MPYTCQRCEFESESEHGLNTHIGKTHGKNTSRCERCGEEFDLLPSREGVVRQCSECFEQHGHLEDTRRKMLESRRSYEGQYNPMYGRKGAFAGKELPQKMKQKISSSLSGEDNPYYGVTGEDHPTWNGGYDSTPFGNNWEDARRRALERDFERCRCCRMSGEEHKEEFGRGLHVHHKTPRSYFLEKYDNQREALAAANKQHNLITVCAPCHREMEVV